jgi:hypothetical protein
MPLQTFSSLLNTNFYVITDIETDIILAAHF